MRRLSSVAALPVLCVLLLAACSTGTPSGTESEHSPSSSSEVESSSTPGPSAGTTGPTEIPECESLFTSAQVASLMGADMQLLAGGGDIASEFPAVRSLLESAAPASCTWVLPATERGVVVSVALITSADQLTVTDTLTASAFSLTTVAGASLYSMQGTEEYPFTETHAFGPGAWVAVWDGFGTNATPLAQIALDVVLAG